MTKEVTGHYGTFVITKENPCCVMNDTIGVPPNPPDEFVAWIYQGNTSVTLNNHKTVDVYAYTDPFGDNFEWMLDHETLQPVRWIFGGR